MTAIAEPSADSMRLASLIQECRERAMLRRPRHAAERIEIRSIATRSCPPIVRSGRLVEANAYLRKMAAISFTEAQLFSGIEEAMNCGYPDVTVTYRRQGDTCSSARLWTVHCQPADS